MIVQSRESDLEQFISAFVIGELITMLLAANVRYYLSVMELVAFWMAVQMIATFGVWEVINLLERRKK